ncbi:uncharacterized protein LOC144441361 [Glandiceps talaboti]
MVAVVRCDLLIPLVWSLGLISGVACYNAEMEYTRACKWTDLDKCTDIASGVIMNPVNWHLPDTVLWCRFVQARRDCLAAVMCDKNAVNETPFNFTNLLKHQVRTYLIYESLGFCDEEGYTPDSGQYLDADKI